MKTLLAATLIALAAGSAAVAAVQPIPGSLTYNNANVRLQKSPVGSNFFHKFTSTNGQRVEEIYQVNADKSVTLVNRRLINDFD